MEKKYFETYLLEDFLTDESFINYCNNNSKDDKQVWEDWFGSHPEKINLGNEAREIVHALSLTLSQNEYQQELKRIKQAILLTPGNIKPIPLFPELLKPTTAESKRRRFVFYMTAAASIVVFCLVAYFLLQQAKPFNPPLVEKYNNGKVPMIIRLSDSTVVTLAVNSSLQYPAVFVNKDRFVYLNGEANFRVAHNATHPFKVQQGNLVATVLGTVFNVRKQQADSGMVIELLQGKLQVDAKDSSGTAMQSIMLKPNERVVYQRNGKQFYKEIMAGAVLALAQKDIEFYKDDFETIAKKIKAVFGGTLINTSNKKAWHFTGNFKSITLKEIMENICVIKQVNYQVNGDTILIK